ACVHVRVVFYLRNIASMRRVTAKPPNMLMAVSASASTARPRINCDGRSLAAPASGGATWISAPMAMIDEMALVTLMRGVCSDGGQLRWRRRPGDAAFLDDGQAADRVVVHVDVNRAVFRLAQLLGDAQQVVRIQRRRLPGEAAGQVGVADDGDAVPHHGLARLG